ncbi:MAG: hypothetical protein WB689_34075 [Xanthobacteraceae bacterium]
MGSERDNGFCRRHVDQNLGQQPVAESVAVAYAALRDDRNEENIDSNDPMLGRESKPDGIFGKDTVDMTPTGSEQLSKS